MKPDPNDLFQSYRFADYHEDYGNVLWWRLGHGEPPYCGTPLDLGQTLAIEVRISDKVFGTMRPDVGGWPFTKQDEESGDLVWTLLPGAIRWPL